MDCAWDLPEDVQALFHYFHTKAAALFLVGGAVRDLLRGIKPGDYDFTVNIPPDELSRILHASPYELDLKGERFGTIGVLLGGKSYEITSFRKESGYLDHRHPELVHFTPSIEEDLARRDFTVNAMAWSPETGLVDPFGGQEDLRALKIRAVGEAQRRMAEDALRILRAIRIAASLEAEILPETAEAMEAYEHRLASLPGERIGKELYKLFKTGRGPKTLSDYPWAWKRSLQAVGCVIEAPDLPALEELDPVASVAFLFLVSPGFRPLGPIELKRSAVLASLATIYRRSEHEDLRALRPILGQVLSLNMIEDIMRSWAWPEDFRKKVLLCLVDDALTQALIAKDPYLAAILFSPERFECLLQLRQARGEDELGFCVEEARALRETIPLDQEDLAWSAEELMAAGFKGEEIRHQRTRGVLEVWDEATASKKSPLSM